MRILAFALVLGCCSVANAQYGYGNHWRYAQAYEQWNRIMAPLDRDTRRMAIDSEIHSRTDANDAIRDYYQQKAWALRDQRRRASKPKKGYTNPYYPNGGYRNPYWD